jgi:hypothetical protein
MVVTRPLPVGRSTRGRSTFGSELPPSEHVPPLPFLPASTVYAASTTCESVAPRSQPWGSPRCWPSAVHSRRCDRSGAFPGGALTLRSFSLDCSRAVSLRSDTFAPFHPDPIRVLHTSPYGVRSSVGGGRPQGFAPQPNPLPRQVLPPGRRPMLPWASSPSWVSKDLSTRFSKESHSSAIACSREGRPVSGPGGTAPRGRCSSTGGDLPRTPRLGTVIAKSGDIGPKIPRESNGSIELVVRCHPWLPSRRPKSTRRWPIA